MKKQKERGSNSTKSKEIKCVRGDPKRSSEGDEAEMREFLQLKRKANVSKDRFFERQRETGLSLLSDRRL